MSDAKSNFDEPRVQKAPVQKATGPMGSQIQPIRANENADRGSPVGGFEDAAPARGMSLASTARAGDMTPPDMAPPSPYPGQSGKAKSVPHTGEPMLGALRTPGSTSGEAVGGSMANLARSGGKPKGAKPHQAAGLPDARPTFTAPAADNPGGSANGQPSTGGSMSGAIQGRRGVQPGGTNVSAS